MNKCSFPFVCHLFIIDVNDHQYGSESESDEIRQLTELGWCFSVFFLLSINLINDVSDEWNKETYIF